MEIRRRLRSPVYGGHRDTMAEHSLMPQGLPLGVAATSSQATSEGRALDSGCSFLGWGGGSPAWGGGASPFLSLHGAVSLGGKAQTRHRLVEMKEMRAGARNGTSLTWV